MASLWPVPAALAERFTVLRAFAHGDGGTLYLAEEPEAGRRGVLKILAPPGKEHLGERPRLRRELLKQATLARSNLVVPLASGESAGVSWLFREWLQGESLEVRLAREGKLPQTEALAVAAQIASALDELHRGGLLHRDVKPAHIFLQAAPSEAPNELSRALLLDAGVVTALRERSTGLESAVGRAVGGPGDQARAITDANGQVVLGSAGYVSPEQLLGKLISFRSDLYSLGCCLYRMLTGRPAFAGETVAGTLSAQRFGELPPLPADLPNGIGALLRSILSKDPQQRPFSAQKLRRTLDPYLPDGALMEKQRETSSHEEVNGGTPKTEQPTPSGTLRPPDMVPGGVVRARSLPPPPPPAAMRPREETTDQIDLASIEEVGKRRMVSSVPPPLPKSVKVPPPPSRDLTEPLRLEQILQVNNAQKSLSVPPVRQPEPPKPLLTPPSKMTVKGVGSPSSGPVSPFAGTMLGIAAPPPPVEKHDAPVAHTAPGIGGLPESELFAQAHQPPPQPLSEHMFSPSPLEPRLEPKVEPKATLMGIGEDQPSQELAPEPPAPAVYEPGDDDATIQLAAHREAANYAAAEQAAAELAAEQQAYDDAQLSAMFAAPAAHAEPELPASAPSALSDNPSFDQHDDTASIALPASTLSGMGARLLSDRRKAMYVGGGIVGVGVLGVLISALFSSPPPPVANPASLPVAAVEPAALPTPVAAAPVAPEPAPVAEPKPTVVPIVPAIPVEPVREAPAAPVLAQAEPPREIVEEPAAEDRHHHHHRHRDRELAAAAPAKSEREEPTDRKSKSAKVSEDKTEDKAAQFEAAREQARSAYAAKQYKAAAAAYEKASKLDPKSAGTYAGLGSARLQLGDNKAAVSAYQHAVQLSPDSSGFHAALGRAYLANGERSKAVASYKKALSIDPKNEAAKAAVAQLGG